MAKTSSVVKSKAPAKAGDVVAALRAASGEALRANLEKLQQQIAAAAVPATTAGRPDPAEGLGLDQDDLEVVLIWRKELRQTAQSLRDRLAVEPDRRKAEKDEISAIQAEIAHAKSVGVAGDAPVIVQAEAAVKEVRARKFTRARRMARLGLQLEAGLADTPEMGLSALLPAEPGELERLILAAAAQLAALEGRPRRKPVQYSTDPPGVMEPGAMAIALAEAGIA
jgi:hypothetical protein